VKPRNLSGERENKGLWLQFDPSVKLEFHGARISSDGGLLLFRELDEVLGLTGLAGNFLHDFRAGANIRHTMTALLRQAVFGRLAGYEDTNDDERLRVDPTMRHIIGGQGRPACEVRDVPVGRSGDPAEPVRDDPGQDRPATAGA